MLTSHCSSKQYSIMEIINNKTTSPFLKKNIYTSTNQEPVIFVQIEKEIFMMWIERAGREEWGFQNVTSEGLCWCHISLLEVLTVPLFSLCPSSGKPAKSRQNRYISTIALWHNDANRHCNAHTYSVCIVVEDHQVTVADIEAWQMVTGVLGIKYVFVNHIGCSSCFRCVPSEKKGRAKHTDSDYQTSIYRVPRVFRRM